MIYGFSWFLVFSFLALWSLAAWAAHAAALWTVSNAGTLLGCALLMLLGAGWHLLAALWRRRSGVSSSHSVRKAAA